MKKLVSLSIISAGLLLAACGQTPSATEAKAIPGAASGINPLNTLGGAVTAKQFQQHPELERAGWKYVASGVAVRKGEDGSRETFIAYPLITEDTLNTLKYKNRDLASLSTDIQTSAMYADVLGQIQLSIDKFGDGSLETYRQRNFGLSGVTPQGTEDIGWFYQQMHGCSGTITAGPMNPGDGAKAFANVYCTGGNPIVVEMWAAAGYGSTSTKYLAFETRNRYDLVTREGSSFCNARSMMSVINPGTVTIGGGVSVGYDTVAGPKLQGNMTSSITYSKSPLITYVTSHPDDTASGC
ncbi:hypothetical protein [Deinococcus sp. PESE-13]